MHSGGATHRDLGEDVEEEGEHREVDANTLPSEPLLQVLGHGDHLNTRADPERERVSRPLSQVNTSDSFPKFKAKWPPSKTEGV